MLKLSSFDFVGPGQAISPETVCSDDESERYFGATGALRCLPDEVADVAFVDHVGLHLEARKGTESKPPQLKLNVETCSWSKGPHIPYQHPPSILNSYVMKWL